MATVPPIISTPGPSSSQLKLLFIVLGILVITGGILAYRLWGERLTLGPSAPTPTPLPKVLTSFESCSIKKEGNPLIWEVIELDATAREVDFRGKVKSIDTSGEKTVVELYSLDGTQSYPFQINKDEIVYGKQNNSLADLKQMDEVMIATNCVIGKEGSFIISRIIRIED